MPDTKISALTAGNPAQGTDEIPISRGAANFKVTAASIAALSPAGTVTSVGGTGTVNGITLTGTVTSTGDLTLGGTLSGVSLTTQVSGTLPTANGGTNLTSFTSGGALYATSTSALTTGTLPLTAGGTGQTTKAAAFNALSPVTTTGDLIIGNGSNSNTRLGIGTNGQVLTSNGTTASWQSGGGGGVTSFSGGFTGLTPNSPTTGAVTLGGTLGYSYGGTGTTSFPNNGALLIGNGGGYSVNFLTAGAGISITPGFGTITIAATGGGGGATINIISVSTSSGPFNSSPPSSSASKPLAASATSPSNVGAFVFNNGSSGFNITSTPSISTIGIQDSTSTFTTFNSGPDFGSTPGSFRVYDKVVSCYGLFIYSTPMLALFTNTRAAMTNPNLAPFDATFGSSSNNPNINVSTTSSGTFFKDSNGGIVVDKMTPNYIISFGTGSPSSMGSVTVTSMSIEAGGIGTFPTTYFDGSDFFTSFAQNTSNGMFEMMISVSNPTLQTLLDNSFRA
jgi:hypothetical protein